MTRLTAVFICLALTACSPKPVTDSAPPASVESLPPPPADVPTLGGIDLTQPISLTGTEPFWGLTVDRNALVFSTPEIPSQPYPPTGFTVVGDTARLATGSLSAILTAKACSDGMSDRAYPLTAELTIDGKTYKGCAIPSSAMSQNRP